MNWKKLLLIGVAISAFAAAPRAEALVSVGIGLGFPVGYGGYGYGGYGYGGYGYGGYGYGGYGYGCPSYYPYSYYRSAYYPQPVVYVGTRYYWHNGRRVYYRHRRHHRPLYWR